MRNRILLYAAIYGGMGVMIGVLMALYTKNGDAAIPLMKWSKNGNRPLAEEPLAEEPTIQEGVQVDAAS